MTIIASAPTRIDLAGGTLDLEPLYLFHPGACSVNLAVTLPATVRLSPRRGTAVDLIARDRRQTVRAAALRKLSDRRLPLLVAAARHFMPATGFTLVTDCAAPAGSGLGGSSSLAIALVAAFRKWQRLPLNRDETLTIAKGIETSVIQVPTGFQDYLPALYGGLNVWHFGVSGIRHEPLRLSTGFMKILERQLVLAYTGVPHFSGMNNWEIFKRHVDGNQKIYNLFEQLWDNALAMASALKAQNLAQVARVLNRDWATRKKLAPGVSTPKIDRLIADGKRVGVIGSRVCGAGGGGCMALLVKTGKAEILRLWLNNKKIRVLPYNIDIQGLKLKTNNA